MRSIHKTAAAERRVYSSISLEALVCSPGPMGIYEQSLALQERNELRTMALDIFFDLSPRPYRWLGHTLRKKLGKRAFSAIDRRLVRTHPIGALSHRVRQSFADRLDDAVFWNNDQFDRWIARHLPEFGNLVVAYESAALHSFRRARQLGIPSILYQPIGVAEYALEALGREAARFPQLASTLRYNWFPPRELERRREERQLADAIFCASSFTRRTLIEQGVPSEKIVIEPYGVDQSLFKPTRDKYPKFSLIWAGSFTQTKGIAYLLEAMARLSIPDMELVLAGYPYGGVDPVRAYEDRVLVRRIGHVTRAQLAEVMPRCHVHVFPTILDGFGRNIIEAMACGLPVITTPNCAGPDLIDDGVTGFIVPICDVDALCDRLSWIHAHPEEAMEMGELARRRVASLTQADYRRRFADRVEQVWSSVQKHNKQDIEASYVD
jgi:glycosyltransferase involved in cell wall biosynthesis